MSRYAWLLLSFSLFAQDTRVILLGTGTPNPEPLRMGSAVAVVSGERVYLVDCGPGVVRRAAEAGLKMEQLTRLFVTHLHSDHTAGYPDLILTPANSGRSEPLEAFGPPGLRAMTAHIVAAWKEDVDSRFRGGEPVARRGFQVIAHDVKPGEVYRDAGMRVIAFRVDHGEMKAAYGYRFEAPDKTIVLSGDTTYSQKLIEAAKGCDILVHEVYSAKALAARPAEWQRYHRAQHTSGIDVGRVAAAVHPRTLVLYHTLPWSETPEEIIGEVGENFSGKIVYGNDLDVIR